MKGLVLLALMFVYFGTDDSCAFAAAVSPNLAKAKQDADSKGYVFLTTKDEIVAKAKKRKAGSKPLPSWTALRSGR